MIRIPLIFTFAIPWKKNQESAQRRNKPYECESSERILPLHFIGTDGTIRLDCLVHNNIKEPIMEHAWPLQDAKNKLSEVIERAIKIGPQEITRRGRKAAVVLSFQEYNRLLKRAESLGEFFHQSPLRGVEFQRIKDTPRKVDL